MNVIQLTDSQGIPEGELAFGLITSHFGVAHVIINCYNNVGYVYERKKVSFRLSFY